MKHAREDYNRIQDPEELIPKDEPVFLLRGQDVIAPYCLRLWADELDKMDGDPDMSALVRNHAAEMEKWQDDVKIKVPDL